MGHFNYNDNKNKYCKTCIAHYYLMLVNALIVKCYWCIRFSSCSL